MNHPAAQILQTISNIGTVADSSPPMAIVRALRRIRRGGLNQSRRVEMAQPMRIQDAQPRPVGLSYLCANGGYGRMSASHRFAVPMTEGFCR